MQADRSSSTVQLIRFWESRNLRRNGDLKGVVMILLNSQLKSSHSFMATLLKSYTETSRPLRSCSNRLWFSKELSKGETSYGIRSVMGTIGYEALKLGCSQILEK
ncbi:uncharacterized protein LOC125608942 isoform X2 [Brassica napus]|uniref:uncharacterized protein LOC125608942 isoform X2 n=1 Tax=Brassica napus TaxID=3708 RepID=UPI002078D6D5|nr:uncharacterized protein LOC125608942 isoform X2 [Brassica napus]